LFKIESRFDAENLQTEAIQKSLDLRDPEKHMELINDYYKNNNLSDDDKQKLRDLVNKSLSEISHSTDNLRNVKWSINKLKFDNTFSYGENNEINFESLPGITGIFGRNARGKSSIIGTIAYALFNTSDRGSIKNLHLVNTRKNDCQAEIDISINSIPYRIVRTTKKKNTKNGVWAPTNLSFFRLDNTGEIIDDLTEEQRRETEKIIRGMIGDAESFMMTSLASQGEMNTFIKEKATSRKNILSNFLDLTVFEKMNEYSKKESSDLKSKINSYKKLDWDKEIGLKSSLITTIDKDLSSLDQNLQILRDSLEDYVKDLHSSSDIEYNPKYKVKELKKKWESNEKKIKLSQESLDSLNDKIYENESKLNKIIDFIDNFDLKEIKEKRDATLKIEKIILNLKNDLKIENSNLKIIEKSVNKLSEVPCGDMFPTCKFIKESHKNKNKIEGQKDNILKLRVKIDDMNVAFKKLSKVNYEEQIEKYNSLIQRKSQLTSLISESKVMIKSNEKDIEAFTTLSPKLKKEYEEALEKYNSQDKDNKYQILERKIKETKSEIKKLDSKRINLINSKASHKASLDMLQKNKKEYSEISKDLRVYDLFSQATSNRGIPVQIIHSMIPQINSEIAKILKGVAGFTVELEVDLENNNAMDLYINYGDSRRIMELGSGMEKMMASLAIRVALINVSTLPKTNILLIDEGFGALDETNLESCGKLLQSLKKYFRNIVVISHIDEIKDIVDNTIDIMKKGADSYVYQP